MEESGPLKRSVWRYPAWGTGTWKPDHIVAVTVYYQNEDGGTWVGYCYPWGYADNHPNRSEFSQFKIDWAVDQNGNHVELDKIDFVKIYTAVNQNVGWMGEISTEVMTVEDLHFEN